jgi:hypothetical protein
MDETATILKATDSGNSEILKEMLGDENTVSESWLSCNSRQNNQQRAAEWFNRYCGCNKGQCPNRRFLWQNVPNEK